MNSVLASILGSLTFVVLVGLVVMLLVMLTQSIFAVRRRGLCTALATILFKFRKDDADESVSESQLRSYCKSDARLLIESCQPQLRGKIGIGRVFGDTLVTLDRQVLSDQIDELLYDVRDNAARIANELGHRAPTIRGRLIRSRHLVTVAWALIAAIAHFRFPALFWRQTADPPLFSLFPISMPVGTAGPLVSVLLTALAFAVAAGLLYALVAKKEDLVARTEAVDKPRPGVVDLPQIGRDGCAVRAINFAGGGFDSIMQLGVVHALMVIQGRPPDAVVGLSTGAIPAAALAEVMQAGEAYENEFTGKPWASLTEDEQVRLQTERMRARVQRFRGFENAAYQARERLYDALTPDAYQIEANEPLVPLKTPFYQTEERKDKVESLTTRSGLLRLYNDLLAINIPFGTLTRAVRRILGFKASGDIPGPIVRNAIRLLEFNRIWLLIGSNIRGVARLLPVLVRPLFPARFKVRPMSAGSLIFRFPINRLLLPGIRNAAVFVLLAAFWLGGGLVPLIPVIVMALPNAWDSDLAWSTLTIYVVLIGGGFLATYRFDASNLSGAIFDNIRGFTQFIWLLVKLSLVLIAVMFALTLIVEPTNFIDRCISVVLQREHSDWVSLTGVAGVAVRTAMWTAVVVAVGAVLFSLVLFVIGISLFYTHFSAKFRKVRNPFSFGSWYTYKFLQSYNLEKSLFHPYDLRSYLIEMLDENYYGRTDLNDVVSDSLRNRTKRSSNKKARRKRVKDYRSDRHAEPIHVGIAAANVLTGDLEIIADNEPVIDSIEAAMALVPFYPPRSIGGSVYVNGSNIANVPTRATSTFMRNRINPKSGAIHLYSVSPFPINKPGLKDPEHRGKPRPYVHLWEIVKRAVLLQRHRDAQLEQKLTEFYTHVIPECGEDGEVQNQIRVRRDKGPGSFTRVWVTPIESNEPLDVNKRILLASRYQQRTVVAQTIADGCRASLEMMIRPSIRATAKKRRTKCLRAVQIHLESQKDTANLTPGVQSMTLPGSKKKTGPGLREICERCALNRAPTESKTKAKEKEYRGHLQLNESLEVERPPWPHERALTDGSLADDPSIRAKVSSDEKDIKKQYRQIKDWPLPRQYESSENGKQKTEIRGGNKRPTVSLLFSGGVFRGVFQMGVLNALNEMRVKPDLIAGASIGAITAAMVARVFAMQGNDTNTGELEAFRQRQRQIARLSAVYLAVDRLVLTDRFADFVRNLTIRASQIDFSMREADHFFRKYDHPRSSEFDRLARKVLAGLERMFYVNPYQLNDLVRTLRSEDEGGSVDLIRDYTQQWLRRMGVSVETLGAEPLKKLIEQFVIPNPSSDDAARTRFNIFAQNGMQMLATATNLQNGELEIIGEPPARSDEDGEAVMLMEALLVSSAFPGVFRPRWSWDLRPGTRKKFQYIDGGVLDNLPIEPVFDFLNGAQAAKKIAARPTNINGVDAPHLMFAASLEVNTPQLLYRDQWRRFQDYWPALLSRTKELRYNTKSDIYCKAERNLRHIYNYTLRHLDGRPQRQQPTIVPMDVDIITVKPNWLCGTFGFHPMLGFRRENQARNIAHGCAATLLRFARIPEEYLVGWGIDDRLLPRSKSFDEAHTNYKATKVKNSDCWLRPGISCPYAADNLHKLNSSVSAAGRDQRIDRHTIGELSKIHTFCRQRKTHRPDERQS